jgi:hypothetical protein
LASGADGLGLGLGLDCGMACREGLGRVVVDLMEDDMKVRRLREDVQINMKRRGLLKDERELRLGEKGVPVRGNHHEARKWSSPRGSVRKCEGSGRSGRGWKGRTSCDRQVNHLHAV